MADRLMVESVELQGFFEHVEEWVAYGVERGKADIGGAAAMRSSARRVQAHVEHLERATAEAERDAERYRWLKQQPSTITFDSEITFVPVGSARKVYVSMIGYTELDAAIDAAMQEPRDG